MLNHLNTYIFLFYTCKKTFLCYLDEEMCSSEPLIQNKTAQYNSCDTTAVKF